MRTRSAIPSSSRVGEDWDNEEKSSFWSAHWFEGASEMWYVCEDAFQKDIMGKRCCIWCILVAMCREILQRGTFFVVAAWKIMLGNDCWHGRGACMRVFDTSSGLRPVVDSGCPFNAFLIQDSFGDFIAERHLLQLQLQHSCSPGLTRSSLGIQPKLP